MTSSHSEAVDMMIRDHVGPLISKYDSNKFRWEVYVNEDVDNVFKKHLTLINAIYKQYSRALVKPGQKAFMSLQEFTDLCNTAKLINDKFTTNKVNFAFNLAMMTQVNELDLDRHCQMTFVEFLEALGRVAYMGMSAESIANYPTALEEVILSLLKIAPAYIRDTYEKNEAKNLSKVD
jgi:hypothetical protein